MARRDWRYVFQDIKRQRKLERCYTILLSLPHMPQDLRAFVLEECPVLAGIIEDRIRSIFGDKQGLRGRRKLRPPAAE